VANEYSNDPRDLTYFRNSRNAISDRSEYLALFEEGEGKYILGEATPLYLVHPKVAERIYDFNPEAKIIAVFRNPFDALYATFKMVKRFFPHLYGGLLETLKTENPADTDPYSSPRFIRSRFYFSQIMTYYNIFSPNQIMVIFLEDIQEEQTFREVFKFLGVDENITVDLSQVYNTESNIGFHPMLAKMSRFIPMKWKTKLYKLNWSWVTKLTRVLTNKKSKDSAESSKCPKEVKEYLSPILKPEIDNLQELIGRDLSHWINS
jgi:hypothetical protein